MGTFQVREMGEKHKKVVFLLSGWRNRLWMFWLFSKIISLNGYYCITYAYDDDVLSPDTGKTSRRLKEIRDHILKIISSLKDAGCTEFAVFGTSLGSLIALMVADASPDISRVILNTTGADIAETVLGWDRYNPSFRNELIRNHLTLEKLRMKWNDISPIRNINNLGNKKILVYLSKNDDIIPLDQGMRLVDGLKKRNYTPSVIVNPTLKHLYTGIYNLINAKPYLSFLRH